MESNFQSRKCFMLKHNNELPRGKGKIHYSLFINQSNGADQTLLNYGPHAKPWHGYELETFWQFEICPPFFYKLASTRPLFLLELNADTTWMKRTAFKHLNATKKLEHSGRLEYMPQLHRS